MIQNFARKIVTGSSKFDHVTPPFRQLNCLPVKQLLQLRDSIMAFNNLAPVYLCNKFHKRSSIHDRVTRGRENFGIPLFRTVSRQCTFTYRAVDIWNHLDDKLKSIASLKAFKHTVENCIRATLN